MGVELRPLQAADMGKWADPLAACEKVDRTGEHYDADDLPEEFEARLADREPDFVGAWLDDHLVGGATVVPATRPTSLTRSTWRDGRIPIIGARASARDDGVAAGARAPRPMPRCAVSRPPWD